MGIRAHHTSSRPFWTGTSYSLTLEIIGVLLVVIGVIVLFLNNSMVQTLVDLVTKTEPFAIRTGAVFGLLFGGFIIYASA